MHGATKWVMSFSSELHKNSDNRIVCTSFNLEKPWWLTVPVDAGSGKKQKKGSVLTVLVNYFRVLCLFWKVPGDTDVVVFHAEPSTILIACRRVRLPRAKMIYYCYQPPRELYDLWPVVKMRYSPLMRLVIAGLAPFWRWFDRFLVRRADSILVWGGEYESYVRSIYGDRPIYHLPASIDFNMFAGRDQNLEQEIAEKYKEYDHVLLVNAALVLKKNVDQFVRLIHQLRIAGVNACGIVIGEGELCDQIETLAEELELGSAFDLVGYVTQEALPCYYYIADAVLYLEHDGAWSMSIIEAAAAGKPVVVAPGGSMTTLVRSGETGVILPRGYTLEVLVEAVKNLLSDIPASRHMGEENYRHNKKYSLEQAASTFQGVLSGSSGKEA
jgi:glycosyltransferase involved in cell wall biosynthesis